MNLEELKKYTQSYIKHLELSQSILSNLKVWIDTSKHDSEIIAIRKIYKELFNFFKIEFLECDVEAIIKSRIDYDVLFSFAATPGVSARAIELVVTHEVDIKRNIQKEKMYIYMPRKYKDGYIAQRLRDDLVSKKLFDIIDEDILKKSMNTLINIASIKDEEMKTKFEPEILILTALDKEIQALTDLLGKSREDFSLESERIQYPHYKIGNKDVVLAQSGMGNNLSSAVATKMFNKYPTIKYVIMVGIAGGIPNAQDKVKHIRLGDIVISGDKGIIQHDMGKETVNGRIYNFNPRPPCATLLKNATRLVGRTGKNEFSYWSKYDKLLIIDEDKYKRQQHTTLNDTPWLENTEIELPSIPDGYDEYRPRIHIGSIASGNSVIKSSDFRNQLVKDFPDIKAVEMEASGLADASWLVGKDCFIVRGICDFCNPDKTKEWQEYAAAVAAAFTCELIETL